MPEQELVDAIKSLRPPKRTYWGKIVDAAISAVIVALVIGFFAQVWSTASGWQESIRSLNQETTKNSRELRDTQDILIREVADIKVFIKSYCDEIERLKEHTNEIAKKLSENNMAEIPAIQSAIPDPPSEKVYSEIEEIQTKFDRAQKR